MSHRLDPDTVVVHLDLMQRAARSICHSKQDADDLVQDTCVRLLAKERTVRVGEEAGYVITALRNTHINRHRATVARPQPAELTEAHDCAEARADASAFDLTREREVLGWVERLPEEPRKAVKAVDVLGLSRAEAAAGLGVSDRVLAERLKRGRNGLAERLAA